MRILKRDPRRSRRRARRAGRGRVFPATRAGSEPLGRHAAPPSAIFPIASDLRRFREWSPWLELDPATTYTFTGPTEGVGQTMTWASKDPTVGSGSMAVTLLEPDNLVEMSLAFGRQGQRAILDPPDAEWRDDAGNLGLRRRHRASTRWRAISAWSSIAPSGPTTRGDSPSSRRLRRRVQVTGQWPGAGCSRFRRTLDRAWGRTNL